MSTQKQSNQGAVEQALREPIPSSYLYLLVTVLIFSSPYCMRLACVCDGADL